MMDEKGRAWRGCRRGGCSTIGAAFVLASWFVVVSAGQGMAQGHDQACTELKLNIVDQFACCSSSPHNDCMGQEIAYEKAGCGNAACLCAKTTPLLIDHITSVTTTQPPPPACAATGVVGLYYLTPGGNATLGTLTTYPTCEWRWEPCCGDTLASQLFIEGFAAVFPAPFPIDAGETLTIDYMLGGVEHEIVIAIPAGLMAFVQYFVGVDGNLYLDQCLSQPAP